MDYITRKKQSYFQIDEEYAYCSGIEESCEDEDFQFIDWDSSPKDLDIDNIKLLSLNPTKQQLKNAKLPKFISDLSGLEHLQMDLNFLRDDLIAKLPSSVKALTLSRNLEFADIQKDLLKNKVEWQSSNRLEDLSALMIIAEQEKESVLSTISEELFPSLRYLGFGFSKDNETEILRNFTKLTDLELTHVNDLPLFENIEHLPVSSLSLIGTGDNFDFAKITSLESLELLRLNGSKSLIDWEILTILPNLKEIVAVNCKNSVNVESLLNCKSLESLKFLNCDDPFKKVAKQFENHGFERLEIKYA